MILVYCFPTDTEVAPADAAVVPADAVVVPANAEVEEVKDGLGIDFHLTPVCKSNDSPPKKHFIMFDDSDTDDDQGKYL